MKRTANKKKHTGTVFCCGAASVRTDEWGHVHTVWDSIADLVRHRR